MNREIDEALAAIERLRDSGDDHLKWLSAKLLAKLRLMMSFKSNGQYNEAKYTAKFVAKDLDELTSAQSSAQVGRAATQLHALIRDYLSLPDLEVVDDHSAVIVNRSRHGYEKYPVGTVVRVADLESLTRFLYEWKYHHSLKKDQLKFAGMTSIVSGVEYYHGGDVLYRLADSGRHV